MNRRTPAQTKEVRRIWAEHFLATGLSYFSSDPVYDDTGLEPSQIRDAIWAPSADVWRRGLVKQRREAQDALHRR